MLLGAIYMLFGFLHGTQEKVGDIQVVVVRDSILVESILNN